MLTCVGRGLMPVAPAPFSKCFYLTRTLPREITFTRASSATYVNESGQLVSAAANKPRFDHDANGNRLGLFIEGAITNKNSNYNANPTTTTGFTTAGDAAGVLSVVDDSAALAAAGLDQICTSGKVYKADNAGGSGSFVVYVPGTTGNTNKHSASIYIRSDGTGRVCRLFVGQTTMDINEGPWTRYKLENQTPDSSTRKITITVDAGEIIYFILNQLEENSFASSVIVTQGASASRSTDRPYIDAPAQYPWFDETQGYMAVRYYLPRLNTADSYIAVAHDGSSANTIGLRLDATDHDLVAYMRAASATAFSGSNDDFHVTASTHGAGLTWKSDGAMILSGGLATTTSYASAPSGITRIDLGARNGGASPLYGHIQMMEIGIEYLDARALGTKIQKKNDVILACAGQSLMTGHFNSQNSNSEAGKQQHRSSIGPALPERLCVMVNGATGSSAACKTSNDTFYWWDVAGNTRGPSLNAFYTAIDNGGIRPTAVLWAQGEEDSHHIGIETSRANYKSALQSIFTDMRATLGDIPVFIQRIGRRNGGYTNTGGVQAVREVQQEMIDENNWCHTAGEIYDLGLHDNVHLNDAGYISAATRNAACILPVFDTTLTDQAGPRITAALRTGTSVTVTLSHHGGTDFTPVSSITGFVFMDDSTPLTISSAAQTDAETLTLTLGSTPSSGNETLYYGYDDMAGIVAANLIRDNSASATSLRTTIMAL
jgi:hypothetical protein